MDSLQRNNYLTVWMLLLSFITLTGCASIIGKSSPQVITINSNPSEANVRIENLRTGAAMYSGKTPYSATLERGAGYFKSARYNVVVEKDGHQSMQFIIDGSANGWYIGGNIIFGGLIGWLIVDPLTGAMWTLSPEMINANLAAKTSLLKNATGLVVLLKNDVPKELINKMEPVNLN